LGTTCVPTNEMASSEIAGFVNDVRKKQNFRQLASYSVQCLAKAITPPRGGWEANATEAFRLGAADALAGVAALHGSDPTIFEMVMDSLNSMASLPRIGAQLVASGALTSVVPAVAAFWDAMRDGDMPEAELSSRLAPALSLFARSSRQDPDAFAASGAASLAVRIAHNACGLGEQEGSRRLPGILASAVGLVDSLSRTRAVQAALILDESASGALERLVAVATTSFDDAGGSGSPGGKQRRATMRVGMLEDQSTTSSRARVGAQHMGPSIRALERLARVEEGLVALKALRPGGQDVVAALSVSLEELGSVRADEAIAVRLLGRLLGGDLAPLLTRAEAEVSPESASQVQQQELACRLLAALCRDSETIDVLARGGASPEDDRLLRCVSLVTTVVSAASRLSIVEVLRRAASHSDTYRNHLLKCSVLPIVAWAMFNDEGDEEVVAECGGCVAALAGQPPKTPPSVPTAGARAIWSTPVEALERNWLTECERAAQVEKSAAAGAYSILDGLVGRAAACPSVDGHGYAADGPATPLDETRPALGDLILNCLFQSVDSEGAAGGCLMALISLAKHGVTFSAPYRIAAGTGAAKAMSMCPQSTLVASLATSLILELFKGVVSTELGTTLALSVEEAGCVKQTIRSLLGSKAESAAEEAEEAATNGPGAGSGEELVAMSLRLLAAVLPADPRIVAEAKQMGCIRAVLAGATRHRSSELVAAAFQSVVGALDIRDAEVASAVDAVVAGVGKIRSAFVHAGAAGGGGSAESSGQVESLVESLGPSTRGADIVGRIRAVTAREAEHGATSACKAMEEPLALLEAVTIVPKFAVVAYSAGATPALATVLGLLSVVPSVAATAGSRIRAVLRVVKAADDAGADTKPGSIVGPIVDVVLSRASSALINLIRTSAEVASGQASVTGASDEDIRAARSMLDSVPGGRAAMDSNLHNHSLYTILSKALAERPSKPSFAASALTLMQWLSWGSTTGDVRARASELVAAGIVEGVTAVLRSQAKNLVLMGAVADALGRIAESPKGAVAVATRGATRQLARQLGALAAVRTRKADSSFLRFLEVLSVCAAGDETVEILRKQGLAAALVKCHADMLHKARAGATHSAPATAGEDEGALSAAASSSSRGRSHASGEKESAAPTESYEPEPPVINAIEDRLSSLLGRLLTEADVASMVKRLHIHSLGAQEAVAAATKGARGGARSLKPWEGMDEGPGLEADAAQLALVAGASAGRRAGAAILSQALDALVRLLQASAALAVAKGSSVASAPASAATADDQLFSSATYLARGVGEIVRNLRVIAPRGVRTVVGVDAANSRVPLDGAAAEYAFGRDDAFGPGGVENDAFVAVDAVTSALGDDWDEGEAPDSSRGEAVTALLGVLDALPDSGAACLHSLAILCNRRGPASLVMTALDGRAISVVVDAVRSALDVGEETLIREGFLTLGGAARVPWNAEACVAAGVLNVAAQAVGELSHEGDASTVSAALAAVAAAGRFHGKSLPSLLKGGILADLRSCVQRLCGDAPKPSEAALAASSGLMRLLIRSAGPQLAEDGSRAEDITSTLRRIVKIARGSPTFTYEPLCSSAVLRLLAAASTAGDGDGEAMFPKEAASRCLQALEEADSDKFVELALVSSSATPEVLSAGRWALSALGKGAAKVAETLEAVKIHTAALVHARESSSGAGEAMSALGDSLRSLSTTIVAAADEGELRGVGNWDAFWAVDQAMIETVATSQAVAGDLGIPEAAKAVVACLSVGVQMMGRLSVLVASQFDAQLNAYYAGTSESWMLPEGADIPPSEVVRAATRVLASGVVNSSVIEAACGCVQAVVESTRKASAVDACAASSTVQVLERLSRLLGRLERRARAVGEAFPGATSGAADVRDDGEEEEGSSLAAASAAATASTVAPASIAALAELVSAPDAQRAMKAIKSTLRSIAEGVRGILEELGNDSEKAAAVANVPLLQAACLAASTASYWHAEADELDSAKACRALLGKLVEALMNLEGGYDACWQLASDSVNDVNPNGFLVKSKARLSVNGAMLATLASSSELDERTTPEGCLTRTGCAREIISRLAQRYVGADGAMNRRVQPDDVATPGTVGRLVALFGALNKSMDMVYGTGRVWRRREFQGEKAAEEASRVARKMRGKEDAEEDESESSTSKARRAFRKVVRVILSTIRLAGPEAARRLVQQRMDVQEQSAEAERVLSDGERATFSSIRQAARLEASAIRDSVVRLVAQTDVHDVEYEFTDDATVFDGTRAQLISGEQVPGHHSMSASIMDSLTDLLIAPAHLHDPTVGSATKALGGAAGEEVPPGEDDEGSGGGVDVELVASTATLLPNIISIVPVTTTGGGPKAENVVFSAMDALTRITGVSHQATAVTGVISEAVTVEVAKERVLSAAKAGTFRALSRALESHTGQVEMSTNCMVLLNHASASLGLGVQDLGLDRRALQTVQKVMRNHASTSAELASAGSTLVDALCDVFQEESGEMFTSRVQEFLAAAAAARGCKRYRERDTALPRVWSPLLGGEHPWGPFFYVESDDAAPTWDCPAPMAALLSAATALDRSQRMIQEAAVDVASAEDVKGLVDVLQEHVHDPGLAAVCVGAISRVCSRISNLPIVADAGAIPVCSKATAAHPYCPRILECVAEMALPMSFEDDLTCILSETGYTDPLTFGLRRFHRVLTSFYGSPLQWPEPGQEAANETAKIYQGPMAVSKNRREPRLAKMCFQVLANMACENVSIEASPVDPSVVAAIDAELVFGMEEVASAAAATAPPSPPPGSLGGDSGTAAAPRAVNMVDRFVELGGIVAMARTMNAHSRRIRLLEDALCLLSNVAYTGDELQIAIGVRCLGNVANILQEFHGDAHLFRMALRAIGNLSRLDENIVRAVGHGVISGIVRGMRANQEDIDVVRLAVDVLGNLASVDERVVGVERGMATLRETFATSGADPAMLEKVDSSGSLKEAICACLHLEEAPLVVLEVMQRFPTKVDILTSCLRTLHYLAANTEQVRSLVADLNALASVVMAMRSCDFDAELIRRGSRVIGAALEVPQTRALALSSGAPQVLMNAIETHSTNPKVFFVCLSVVMLGQGPEMFQAAQELSSVRTLCDVALHPSQSRDDVLLVLSVLNGWATDSVELSAEVAEWGSQMAYTLRDMHSSDLVMAAAVFQFLATLSAKPRNARTVLAAGVISMCKAVLDSHIVPFIGTDDETPSRWRPAILQMLAMLKALATASGSSRLMMLSDGVAYVCAKIDVAFRQLTVQKSVYFDREAVESGQALVVLLLPDDKEGLLSVEFEENKALGALLPGEDLTEGGAGALPSSMTAASAAASASRAAAPPVPPGGGLGSLVSSIADVSSTASLMQKRYPDAPSVVGKALTAIDSDLAKASGRQGATGLPVTVWGEDGAPHKRNLMVVVSSGRPTQLRLEPPPNKSDKQAFTLELSDAVSVLNGLPPLYKGRFFGSSAKPTTSMHVLDRKGRNLLHVEAASTGSRDVLSITIHAVCRAGGGCLEQHDPPM
jgi:hypothetical protein